jgi:hypothetical protein
MQIERIARIEAVLVTFDVLFACGFDWSDYASETDINGQRHNSRPEVIVIDFLGGAIRTPTTPADVMEKMHNSSHQHNLETAEFFQNDPIGFLVDPRYKATPLSLVAMEHCGFEYDRWEVFLRNAGRDKEPTPRTVVAAIPERWKEVYLILDSTPPAT